MKSNAPWSVKGIERDARETAKEAAKREGMTVGEWLNQMIYTAGEPQSSGGDVEGLQLRDIVTAIEHLHKRVADANTQGAGAIGEMTSKIGDVVERIQRLERVKPSKGSPSDLAARVERIEEKTSDRSRIDALKALEKAVAQVAVQFSTAQKTSIERLNASERQLQELASRIDNVGPESEDASGVNFLKDAIDGLSVRIARTERMAGEAANLTAQAGSVDPAFVESTGNRLRVLGDEIKRGGDQIRGLETTIAKLTQQIDAAERRSAEGVQKVADTISDMRDQFVSGDDASRANIDAAIAAANQDADERIDALQKSFEAMISRLDNINPGEQAQNAVEPPAADLGNVDNSDTDDIDGALSAADFTAPEPEVTDDDVATAIDDQESPEAVIKPEALGDESLEEDPFAFADEIEAALDAADDDNPDSDFAFELDDDADTAGEQSGDGSKALLSEIQEAFGKKEPSGDDDAELPIEDDLDAILADLDDMASNAADLPIAAADQPHPAEETKTDQPAQSGPDEAAASSDSAPQDDQSAAGAVKEDYLKAARRHAKKAAQQRAEDAERPSRRRLSPKQKAILAARARQKRRESEAPLQTPQQPGKVTAAQDALRDANEEHTGETEEKASALARFAAGIRSKLPFLKGKNDEPEAASDDAKPAEIPDENISRNGDRAAFETLKSTAAARPLTMALAAGIILATVGLFLLVKDLIFKSPDAAIQPPAITGAEAGAIDTAPDFSADTALPEVPSAPAIDPNTLYKEAMAGLNGPEDEAATAAALKTLEQAAALGHPPAQLQLGELYKTGQGVESDPGQARTWFRRAANGGNILAMHRIGVMTARGDGGPADTGEAIGWFELAANHGLVDSQYNLGAIFHPSSDGAASTVQDAGKAYYWYSLAAQNGDTQALPLAAGVAVALTAAQKQDIDKTIAAWEASPADPAANEMAAP